MGQYKVLVVAVAFGIWNFGMSGSEAAPLSEGEWEGQVSLQGGTKQQTAGMAVSLTASGAGRLRGGTVKFKPSVSCGMELDWRASGPEGETYAVIGTSPSGFCKRFRAGELHAKAVVGQCAIAVELAPNSELAETEGTESVKATLHCAD